MISSKMRMSCAGVVPEISGGIFGGGSADQGDKEDTFAQEIEEERAEIRRKERCKYRKSCYETGPFSACLFSISNKYCRRAPED